jgi:hypothetical protein
MYYFLGKQFETMGFWTASKAFFKLLANRELSESFEQLLEGKLVPRVTPSSASKEQDARGTKAAAVDLAAGPVIPESAIRNDAVSLLSALQREARLIDLVKEPLDSYSDAQIGGAAREVLKNSAVVVERMFGILPLTEVADGDRLTTPDAFDPAEFRLMGNVTGQAPFSGTVLHHGWKVTRCEIPQWNGKPESAKILAPIELEVV